VLQWNSGGGIDCVSAHFESMPCAASVPPLPFFVPFYPLPHSRAECSGNGRGFGAILLPNKSVVGKREPHQSPRLLPSASRVETFFWLDSGGVPQGKPFCRGIRAR
tara:strand:- start:945 stop:1262 length:318 start_codon:yes stop_codon:yes gene_type:complete